MWPLVPPVRLMINNTSCATYSANWTSVVRMWVLCSLDITYHELYLHVFTWNISIRTSRHKHPHYVLMWRRIPPSCQQRQAGMESSVGHTSLRMPDIMTQFFKLLSPSLKLPAGQAELHHSSCIPPYQAAHSSFLSSCPALVEMTRWWWRWLWLVTLTVMR